MSAVIHKLVPFKEIIPGEHFMRDGARWIKIGPKAALPLNSLGIADTKNKRLFAPAELCLPTR